MPTENSIEQMLKQLRLEYVHELPSRIDSIENLVVTGPLSETYEDVYRHIHSMKGSAGTHGLQIISTICHHLETQLTEFNKLQKLDTKEAQNHCLAYLDLLRNCIEQIEQGKSSFSSIEKKLAELEASQTTDKYEILVVEPSRMQMQFIRQTLSGYPVTIHEYTNGFKALESLLIKKYHILITALETELLNGEALIAATRLSKSRSADIYTILLTSKSLNIQNSDVAPHKIINRDMKTSEQIEQVVGQYIHNSNKT